MHREPIYREGRAVGGQSQNHTYKSRASTVDRLSGGRTVEDKWWRQRVRRARPVCLWKWVLSRLIPVLKARILREDRDVTTFRGEEAGRKGSNTRGCEVLVADDRQALAEQNKCGTEG